MPQDALHRPARAGHRAALRHEAGLVDGPRAGHAPRAGEFFQWETAEEYLNTRLMSIGSSVDKLREQQGVIIQKGKPYLEDFGETSPFGTHQARSSSTPRSWHWPGIDPLPGYEPVEEPPPGFFRLLYGRHPVHTFAKTQNTPMLNSLYPENEVWINADAAAGPGAGRRQPCVAGESGRRPQRADQGQGHPAHPQGRRLYGAWLWPERAGADPGQRQGGQRRQAHDPLCASTRSAAAPACASTSYAS